MAAVTLSRDEAKQGDLPPVCMRCGRPSCMHKPSVLFWQPWWVSLTFYPSAVLWFLPYLLLKFFFERRASIRAPLCTWHVHHWTARRWMIYGVTIVSILTFVGMISLAMDHPPRDSELLRGLSFVLMMVWLLCLIILIPAVPILRFTGINARRIGEDEVILRGVSAAFVAALQEWRMGHEGSGGGSWDATSQAGIGAAGIYDPKRLAPPMPPGAFRQGESRA